MLRRSLVGLRQLRPGASWLFPLVVMSLGLWLIPVAQTCGFSCVPGNMGDARFNAIILEGFYRWMNGLDVQLISPSFFYPMPGALTFSDNHWGSAWIYVLFRSAGLGRYEAFDAWYVVGFALNFISCHWVLRRFGFSVLASAAGAFAYTFGMPVIAQHGHAQLTYRFLVPVSLLLWERFRADGRSYWLGWLALVVVGQFYMSIYLGYFVLVLLVAWAAAQCLVERKSPAYWFLPRVPAATFRRDAVVALLMSFVAFAALAWLMYPYLYYSHLYAFHRSMEETASMLPRLQSYFILDHSLIWGAMSQRVGAAVPMRHEHQLFLGFGLLGLSLLGAIHSSSPLRRVAMFSSLFIALLTISVGGYSVYLLFAAMPGANSIRAMTRIILVLLLPMAILVAAGIDAVRRDGPLCKLLVGSLFAFMLAESITTKAFNFSINEAHQRLAALQGALPAPLPENALVFVPGGADVPFYMGELDGMELGQAVNRPTLNGYSGNGPPGYFPDTQMPACEQGIARLRAAEDFYERRLHRLLPDAVDGPLAVSGHPECAVWSWKMISLADMGKIAVNLDSVERRTADYLVTASLKNGSSYSLPALPSTHATRLSWQVVARGLAPDADAWNSRVDVGPAIPPGESREITFSVPSQSVGEFEIYVSVVIDGYAWLHDHGLEPAHGTL